MIQQLSRLTVTIAEINARIHEVVWGIPMLLLILTIGIYFTIGTNFFQIRKIRLVFSKTLFAIFKNKAVTKTNDKKAISQFQAMSAALAGTIGTGNIVGVATAIVSGGAGAVFWMWVSAFFGMMTNYSENVLGIYYRKKNKDGDWCGGAMYYIENGFKDKKNIAFLGKPLSIMFALFCVFASFGMGNMAQVNSISCALNNSFDIPPIVTGLILAAISCLVILGGIQRIGKVTEKLVPFMAIGYIVITLIVVIKNFQFIPKIFTDILMSAFGLKAFGGGMVGIAIKESMTWGFKRGIFSNEAGLGSTVMVNSASDVKEPVIQGIWGIFQVFFDTILMCSLTAFVILSSNVVGMLDKSGKILTGATLVGEALSTTFHSASGAILSISILLFAFSTVLGWSYYGTKSLEYLFGTGATYYYKVLFIIFIVIGSTVDLTLAWDISDTLNGLMAIPNLIGLIFLSNTVFKITKNYSDRKITKKNPHLKPMLSAYETIQKEQEIALLLEN